MRVDRDLTAKLIVPALVAGALGASAAGTTAKRAVAATGAPQAAGWTCGSPRGRAAPDAVPPILAPMSCPARRAILRQERIEAEGSADRLPAGARYSDTEMNAYAGDGAQVDARR